MEEALCYTTYSADSSNFLTLALFREAETTPIITGFLVPPSNYIITPEQEKIIKVVENVLLFLGGKELDMSFEKQGELFSYSFPPDKREDALSFFADKVAKNPSKEQLKFEVDLDGLPVSSISLKDYLDKYSNKTFSELNDMFLPVKKAFVGTISSKFRNKNSVLLTSGIQISSNLMALGCQNGNIELWNLDSQNFQPIKLYSSVITMREEDKKIIKLELLSSSEDENTNLNKISFVVGTAGGDVFIVTLLGNYYPEVQKLELSDKMVSLYVFSAERIAIGLSNNSVAIYNLIKRDMATPQFIKLLSLNEDNIYNTLGDGLRGIIKLFGKENTLMVLSEEYENVYLKEYLFSYSSNKVMVTLKSNIELEKTTRDVDVMGNTIILCTGSGSLRLVSEDQDFEVKNVSSAKKIYNLDKNFLIISDGEGASLLLETGEIIKFSGTDKYNVSCYTLLENKKLILAAETGEIELFNIENGESEAVLQEMPSLDTRSSEDKICSIFYDGSEVISISEGGDVIAWE
jgi:hypothetical protein